MTNLVQSLFRIDPTEGLVKYVNAIKPYHSKVLDVLVEYIYTESVTVSIKDKWSWTMTLSRPKSTTEYACGYGLTWDPVKTPESNPIANIINSQSNISLPVGVRLGAVSTSLQVSQNGYSLVSGTKVVVTSTGVLPATVPQIRVGHTYTVNGHNGDFTLTDPITNTVVDFLTNGTGTLSIEPQNLQYNSFLIEKQLGRSFDIAVTNIKANQMSFVDTHFVTQIIPQNKQIIVSADLRPRHNATGVVLDNVTAGHVAGNCSLVFDGVNEDHFTPGTSFIVTGSVGANGTYTVATNTSGRLLTRYDGKNTIVPVDQAVTPANISSGVATVALSTILPADTLIHLSMNSGVGANGRYTVVSATSAFTTIDVTIITVNETISVLAANNGMVHIPVSAYRVPAWPAGLQIQFESTDTFPTPISTGSKLFYIPTKTPGVFNLSTKRYPIQHTDYVNLTNHNAGILSARRAEMFHPGAYVKVSGSHLRKNDGNYIVKQSKPEGNDYDRVYVMEKVPFTTPLSLPYDGLVEFNFDSFDAPVYCPVSKAPDLHSDAFIHETIRFEYSFSMADLMAASATEYRILGYGTSPYGTDATDGKDAYAGSGGSAGAPTGTILTTGIDTQLFGVGDFVETITSVSKKYGTVSLP